MPVMEISVLPIGTETASVSSYIARAVGILEQRKEIKYRLTPMSTVIEAASVAELLMIARKMHEAVLKSGVVRAVTTIRIDDRKDRKISLDQKIDSVKKKLRKSR
ncbi:MAG: MTH1187 family thiamine-binding protein [Candidatus Omnitrophota bacterium]